MYGVVPPTTVASTLPLLPPLQLTGLVVAVATSNVGWVSVIEVTFVQPFVSVVDTV